MQTTLATSVPIKLAEQVDRTAKDTGVTRSRFIRRALEEALGKSGGDEGKRDSKCKETA